MRIKRFITGALFLVSSNIALGVNQGIDMNEKLCFYGEDHVDEPVRFVYFNARSDKYMFVFMEEDNKTRHIFRSDDPWYKKNNIIYTKGKQKIDKGNSQYFEICIERQ